MNASTFERASELRLDEINVHYRQKLQYTAVSQTGNARLPADCERLPQ